MIDQQPRRSAKWWKVEFQNAEWRQLLADDAVPGAAPAAEHLCADVSMCID